MKDYGRSKHLLPFAAVPHAAYQERKLRPGDRDLLARLTYYARNKSCCWPGNDRLAVDLGVCRRTVQYRLRALERTGWIACVRDDDLPSGRRIELLWLSSVDPSHATWCVARTKHNAPPARNEVHANKQIEGEQDQQQPEAAARGTSRVRPAPSPVLTEKLVGLGITPSVAQELAAGFDDDRIERQIVALDHRKARDRAATLVKSIREDWAMPEAMSRSKDVAARRVEEEQHRLQSESRRRILRLHEEKVGEFWDSLTPDEQERFQEAAIEHAEPEAREMIRRLRPDEPFFKAHRLAARDEHIRRVLGLPSILDSDGSDA